MTYSIGQLANAADTRVETIRYYERRGLMPEPPRANSGYRRYPRDAEQRLRFIRRAKRLGFTLKEIMALLRLQAGGERADIKAIAEDKLDEIETRLADLERMRVTLHDVNRRCSGRGPVTGCPIIETLNHEPKQHTQRDTDVCRDGNGL
ncbi:MerR-family transcriptional regulator protein [Salinisphaera shabanensis E1L3A]|uniref:MerR-family transcriptional regulator protein n=1 Tax=Salinisphaera shabanensis E1L3A TaxID=1033802 RepID=U2ENZ8_9GAMM|nr:MerR family transcriptional regulator [Salinisphaera shabanensis]ERJ19847.1 MerR-family transcriptional regulator protein [Salinisphaera shabanensis E1L3A]